MINQIKQIIAMIPSVILLIFSLVLAPHLTKMCVERPPPSPKTTSDKILFYQKIP